jgi:hypothetical protein
MTGSVLALAALMIVIVARTFYPFAYPPSVLPRSPLVSIHNSIRFLAAQ